MAEVARLSNALKPDQFFSKDLGLNVPLLGEIIRREHFIKRGEDRRLYRYDQGVYLSDGEEVARARVREILGERFKARHLHEVVTWLSTFPVEVDQREPEGIINLKNGLLDWRSGELRPHAPEIVSTIQLPTRWNPEATCPGVEHFLARVIPADANPLVWEVIGYSLFPGNPLRKAILLLGPGANGKSVLLRILEALLGEGNVSHVALQALAEDRFSASELYGKLANVYADLDGRAIRQTDLFKMVTGGDMLRGERKYRDAFYFRAMALPLFSANQAPLSGDTTQAWFDRWIVVPMDVVIPETERDPKLPEKLTSADELEGVLVRAVAALRRLLERGHFDVPESVGQANADYREFADSVAAFVEDQCLADEAAWTQRTRLYEAYRRWAESSGRKPYGDRTFYKHVESLGFRPAKIHGARGFNGLTLAAPEEE